MSAGALLVGAFMTARQANAENYRRWINVSHRVGGMLPASLLSMSIQREGEVDLLLRSMEDAAAERAKNPPEGMNFEVHYQNVMSGYWIGGMYETFRLLRQRRLVENSP